MSKLKSSWLVIISVLLFDQIIKIWIKSTMVIGENYKAIGDWFVIHFTENNGMAFGMEFGGEYGKLSLSIFRIIVVIIIGFYIRRMIRSDAHKGFIISISLVFAGALGNIIDSTIYGVIFSHSYNQVATFLPEGGGYAGFLHGRVVDMIHMPILKGTFPSWIPFWGNENFIFFRPVYNIADAAITTGIAILIIFQKRFFIEEDNTEIANSTKA